LPNLFLFKIAIFLLILLEFQSY